MLLCCWALIAHTLFREFYSLFKGQPNYYQTGFTTCEQVCIFLLSAVEAIYPCNNANKLVDRNASSVTRTKACYSINSSLLLCGVISMGVDTAVNGSAYSCRH